MSSQGYVNGHRAGRLQVLPKRLTGVHFVGIWEQWAWGSHNLVKLGRRVMYVRCTFRNEALRKTRMVQFSRPYSAGQKQSSRTDSESSSGRYLAIMIRTYAEGSSGPSSGRGESDCPSKKLDCPDGAARKTRSGD